jgi:hypothetical protein
MTTTVSIELDGSSATYEVTHEIDGIYKATLLSKGSPVFYPFPEKLILIRSKDGWASDHSTQTIGVKIGREINKEERPPPQ